MNQVFTWIMQGMAVLLMLALVCGVIGALAKCLGDWD